MVVLVGILISGWTNVIEVMAASNIEVVVATSKASVKQGEVLDVIITMDKASSLAEIGGLQIDVQVNADYFEYIDKSDEILLQTIDGDMVSAMFNDTEHQFTILYVYMNAEQKPLPRDNKAIVSFQLRAKQEIKEDDNFQLSGKALFADTSLPSKQIEASVQIHSGEYEVAATGSGNGTRNHGTTGAELANVGSTSGEISNGETASGEVTNSETTSNEVTDDGEMGSSSESTMNAQAETSDEVEGDVLKIENEASEIIEETVVDTESMSFRTLKEMISRENLKITIPCILGIIALVLIGIYLLRKYLKKLRVQKEEDKDKI